MWRYTKIAAYAGRELNIRQLEVSREEPVRGWPTFNPSFDEVWHGLVQRH